MSLFRAIKSLIKGPAEMATIRLSSWIQLGQMGHFYQIRNAANEAGFVGWMMISTRGRLEAELEGPKDDLEDFLSRLIHGKITGSELPIERAWGLYQKRYAQLRVLLPEMVIHDKPRRTGTHD